jgi:hypothetical protein
MNFLDLNDDVKLIITKNLLNKFKIRTLLSKHHDLQKKNYLERLSLMMIFVKF